MKSLATEEILCQTTDLGGAIPTNSHELTNDILDRPVLPICFCKHIRDRDLFECWEVVRDDLLGSSVPNITIARDQEPKMFANGGVVILITKGGVFVQELPPDLVNLDDRRCKCMLKRLNACKWLLGNPKVRVKRIDRLRRTGVSNRW